MLLARLSSLAYCLRERAEPTLVEHLKEDPLLGRLLALPANIGLGWKGLPRTNTLAYYENLEITAVKSFRGLARGRNFYHTSCAKNCDNKYGYKIRNAQNKGKSSMPINWRYAFQYNDIQHNDT